MTESVYRIADILQAKADQYELTIFHRDAIAWLEGRLFEKRGHPYLKCLASGRDRRAYPEEIVRQLYVKKLIDDYGYPPNRIQVEKPVFFGSGMGKKRADIVVMHADDPEAAYIIVEVKKPKRQDGIEQLKSYCNAEGSPIGVWTNRRRGRGHAPRGSQPLPRLDRHPQCRPDTRSHQRRAGDAGSTNRVGQAGH